MVDNSVIKAMAIGIALLLILNILFYLSIKENSDNIKQIKENNKWFARVYALDLFKHSLKFVKDGCNRINSSSDYDTIFRIGYSSASCINKTQNITFPDDYLYHINIEDSYFENGYVKVKVRIWNTTDFNYYKCRLDSVENQFDFQITKCTLVETATPNKN